MEFQTDEARRQFEYIERLKEMTQEMAQRWGRPVCAAVKTFGCQMNARDSEKLRGILEQAQISEASSEEDADFVIYNTCTVRENANLKVYGRLGYLGSLKKKHPDKKIILCGCMMQEPEVVEKIKKSYPQVDLIFGTHNIFKFAELMVTMLESDRMVIDIWKDTDQIVEDLPEQRTYPFKSGVNIMFGCNNFCTYCIVPYVRGRERSRRPEDILAEIRRQAADGVKEVMLLGQNVNSYGKNLETPVTFAQLLQQVEQVEGIQRIRFMTSHPKDLSDELIQVMKNSQKICRHMHLPMQSGSTRLLQKMNRHYTKERYLALADKLRSEIPDLAITTDIIVGFPSETEEDFQETLDVVRRVRFESAFTFIYSRRTGTPAAVMEDQVPEAVVKDRFDRLLALVQQISREQIQTYEGRVVPVLTEGPDSQDPSMLTGRMSNNTLVHFPGDASQIGQIRNVRLTKCCGFYYIGEMERDVWNEGPSPVPILQKEDIDHDTIISNDAEIHGDKRRI